MVKIVRCILCGRKLKIDSKDAERLEQFINLKTEYICLDCRRKLIFNPQLYNTLIQKIKELKEQEKNQPPSSQTTKQSNTPTKTKKESEEND